MKKVILTTIFAVCITVLSFGQNSVMDFYKADIEAIKSPGRSNPNGEAIIQKKDIANGFISYGLQRFGMMGFKDMAYFISNNGKKFAVVASFGCGPGCATQSFNFYELQNGKLVDETASYYPSSLKNQVEDALRPHLQNGGLWVKIPQHGTTIQFGYQDGPALEDTNFVAVCELQYNVNNGTFKFAKK